MIPPLSTARLELRPSTLDDIDALHALWREPAVRRYLWDDRAIDRDEAAEVVRALVGDAESRGYGLWLLYPRGGDAPGGQALAGFCALREIAGTPEIEIIYGIAPRMWGQGLATEAAREVLAYAFDALPIARVWGRTDPPNAASIAVIERLGMRAAENAGDETTPLVAFVLDRPTTRR